MREKREKEIISNLSGNRSIQQNTKNIAQKISRNKKEKPFRVWALIL